MTSQAGLQIITIHILPNILKSKGNQATKFGHSKNNNYCRKFLIALYYLQLKEKLELVSIFREINHIYCNNYAMFTHYIFIPHDVNMVTSIALLT